MTKSNTGRARAGSNTCASTRTSARAREGVSVSTSASASTSTNTNTSARVNFPDLDITKLIMALLVVEIHTRPLVGWPLAHAIVQGIDVLAVPFFFMCSAFLCFRVIERSHFKTRDACGSVRVRKTIGKLVWLYVVWTVLFLPVTVYGNLLSSKGLWQSVAEFVRCTLLVGENFYSWPLWYLLASVVAFALVYVCLRAGVSCAQLIALSACFLFAGYFITWAANWQDAPSVVRAFTNTYYAIFSTTRNGIFEGFFYVAVGACLGMRAAGMREASMRAAGMREGAMRAAGMREGGMRAARTRTRAGADCHATPQLRSGTVAALLGGCALGVAGCIFVSNDAHLPFCACASMCLFVLCTLRRGKNLTPHVALRNASTIIYLVHLFFVVVFVFGIFDQAYVDLHASELNPLLFAFSLGGSVLVAIIVIPLANKFPAIKKVFGL